MTLYLPPYEAPEAATPLSGPPAIEVLAALSQCASIEYRTTLDLVAQDGSVLEDLTPFLVRNTQPATITRDCTQEVAASLTLDLACDLAWGRDIIAPSMLVRSGQYQGGQWQRFELGAFVATTPQLSLASNSANSVVAFEKTYLLQCDVGDSFFAVAGSSYRASVSALFVLAAIMPNGDNLEDYLSYSGDWAAKTLPEDLAFPLSESQTWTFLAIVNELLKASGCRPLYTGPDGRYAASALVPPATVAQRWTFARNGSAGPSTVSNVDNTIKRDVWNVPNRWVFIQQGLTFEPTGTDGSNGRYVVDNTTVRPSDQISVGRVIPKVSYLSASGQADLVVQGDAIVLAQLAQAETIDLKTVPWPVAWHYDVFLYADDVLPDSSLRKVQAQSWTLPLNGDLMTWHTQVVALQ